MSHVIKISGPTAGIFSIEADRKLVQYARCLYGIQLLLPYSIFYYSVLRGLNVQQSINFLKNPKISEMNHFALTELQ